MGESIIGDRNFEGKAIFKPPANRFSLYFTDHRQVMVQEEELPKNHHDPQAGIMPKG
jgi:hypothetical protein